MVLMSWLNLFRRHRRTPSRTSWADQAGTRTAADNSRLETLEKRTLLSAVGFDSLTGQLSFFGATDTNDDVEITSLDAHTLRIQVAGGDTIALQGGAFNNPGFTLSSTNSNNDTLVIDSSLVNSQVQAVNLDLGNGTNQITAGGLTIGKLTIQNGGTAILDQVIVGTGGLNVQAQTIQVNGSVSANSVDGGDIVLTTGIAGSVSIDTPPVGQISSAGGNVRITADVFSISAISSINALHAVEILTADTSRHVALGSPADTTTGFLELSPAELNTITADVLRIGSLSEHGNIFITAAVTLDPTHVDTLSLITAGGVANYPTGTLSVTNLRVNGSLGIFLDQNLNQFLQVSQVALHSNSGEISFVSQGDLTVGTVDGVAGVSSVDHVVIVASWTGSLTISNTDADHDVDAGNAAVILGALGNQGVTLQSGADVRGLEGIQVIGNQQYLDGTLTATGGTVILTPAGLDSIDNNPPPPVLIDLGGADSSTQLGISDAELDRIDAAIIQVGDAGDYDIPNIHVTGLISPQHATTLLLTGNSISQQGGLIQVSGLALRTLNGAGNGTALETQISNLAFYNQTSGDVNINNTGALSLATVEDLTQSVNLAGGVNLTTHSPLTIASSMLASGDINLTATESIDAGDDITINTGVTVISTLGSIAVRAGDTLTQSGTLTVQVSGKTITLAGGDNDLDLFGAVTLNGNLNTFDSSPQIWGGSGTDIITINRNNGTVIGGGTVGLYIDAGTGNDHYNLNFDGGPFTRDIAIDDASGVLDTLHVQGTETDDFVTYDSSPAIPEIQLGDRTVYFTGLETANIDGRDAQHDSLSIAENVAGFNPPGPGTVDTAIPLTYSNFEQISIANSLPTVSNLVVTDSDEGGTATLTGTFTDIELHQGTTFILHIDWGDGTAIQDVPVSLDSAAQSFSIDHTYADDNPTGTSQDLRTVSVTVSDDNGGISPADTTTALVHNVNPTINVITFSTSANEGGVALLQGTYADAGTADTHFLVIDWDDGTPLETVNVSGGTFSVTHVYLDDTPTGTGLDLHHPTLTLHDDDGGIVTSNPQILVKNVSPQITSLEVTPSVTEGSAVTLTGTYTDAGTLDTHQILINWGDGSNVETVDVSGGSFSVGHVYLNQPTPGSASGPVLIGVTLRDDDGGQNFQTVSTTVLNANPVITNLDVANDIVENGIATLTGTYTDSGANDTHTLDINWGDGSPVQTVTVSGGSFSITHQYLDDSPRNDNQTVVSVTLRDGDTGFHQATTLFGNFNVPPVISNVQISQATINEGGSVTITGDYSDVGTLDTHTLRVNWNDGSPIEVFQISGGHFSVTHQYFDDQPPGTSDLTPINMALYDDDQGYDTASTSVTIHNVNPTASINSDHPTVTEGTQIGVGSSVGDVGILDTFTYAWTVTKNGISYATGHDPDLIFTTDDEGTYVVNLVVTDDDGGQVTATPQTIQVTGVAPTVGFSTGSSFVTLGQPIEFDLYPFDPGPLDQAANFTYHIDWNDDGTIDQTLVGHSGITITHVFLETGPTQVRISATDKDGLVSEALDLTVNVHEATVHSGVLSVGGTDGNDRIRIKDKGELGVEVFLNGTSLGVFAETVAIQVYGGEGNDNIQVDETITVPCELYGEDGNDTLLGGAGDDLLDGGAGKDSLRGRDGDDILLGGDGNDFLSSGRGADILIGGLGKDELFGFQGGDILVGGTTAHDNNKTALNAIRAEWTSDGTLDVRVANLKLGGGENGNITLQPTVQAPDDGVQDKLYGETGRNWFLSFLTDRVLGRKNTTNRIN